MSMNLHVAGSREITVNVPGSTSLQFIEPQTIRFDLYQTPTKVTYEILRSENQAQAYRDWVIADRWYEYEELVYAEDDIWEEREPIGTRTICHAEYHLQEFDEFIEQCQKEGYTIEFYDM